MKNKYCTGCGNITSRIEIPTSNFSENTGKRIIKIMYICQNLSCIRGRIQRQDYLCSHIQSTGFHKFNWLGNCKCGENTEPM